MGHMKKLIGLFVCLFVFAGVAAAHEGSLDLTSGSVSCKGVSLWQDGGYRVSGRCDGLVYPYETMYNKYVLWGKTVDRGEIVRIAEIDRGYFSGNITSTFEAMYVTAEKDGLVRKPSDKQIVAGPFSFDKSQATVAPIVKETTATVQPKTATVGTVVGKIVSSLFVIILVIVVLVIGASLIFRSRGSVSA